MQVQLVKLEILLEELGLGPDLFVERYPGAFMVAAGLLAIEEEVKDNEDNEENDASDERLIIAPTKPPRDMTRERLDFTTVFKFGRRRAHATGEPHALAGTAFRLQPTGDKSHVTVGRSADCDITVPDRSVSDVHCRIEVTERGVVVIDLQSTNGTSINQQRLEPGAATVLADEDILSVGRYSFQMLSSASLYSGLLEVRPLIQPGS